MREVKIFLGTIERVKDFVNAVTRLDRRAGIGGYWGSTGETACYQKQRYP